MWSSTLLWTRRQERPAGSRTQQRGRTSDQEELDRVTEQRREDRTQDVDQKFSSRFWFLVSQSKIQFKPPNFTFSDGWRDEEPASEPG